MSSYRSNTNKSGSGVYRSHDVPHCAVCKSAGKSEAIWSSHYPKNSKGKVSCITLLSQCCRSCNKPGHTEKYCTTVRKLASNLLTTDIVDPTSTTIVCIDISSKKQSSTKSSEKTISLTNRYSGLGDDSDDDDDVSEPVVVHKSAPVRKRIINWADVESDSDSD